MARAPRRSPEAPCPARMRSDTLRSVDALRRKLERVSRMSRAEIRARTRSLARRKLGWLVAGEGRDDAWVARMQADASSRAGLPAYLGRVLASRIYGVDWTPARL